MTSEVTGLVALNFDADDGPAESRHQETCHVRKLTVLADCD